MASLLESIENWFTGGQSVDSLASDEIANADAQQAQEQLAGADSATRDRVRAAGIDPDTGKFISPTYQQTFEQLHPGESVSEFIADTADTVDAENPSVASNFLSGIGSDLSAIPWKTILTLAIVIVVLMAINEVKSL
jgi:hypothetical protein